MKMNFKTIQHFFYKNRFVFVGLLAIFILIHFLKPRQTLSTGFIKEGFTNFKIGRYSFLAPVPPPMNDGSANPILNSIPDWDPKVITNFIKVFNKETNNLAFKLDPSKNTVKDEISIFSLLVTEEEAIYYIKHKKWPYDGYVMEYLLKNPSILQDIILKAEKNPNTAQLFEKYDIDIQNFDNLHTLQKFFPNRSIYSSLIAPIEQKEVPQPLAYQIFMGTVPYTKNA